nr:MAG TPA: hypothetical protein [Caudoviricetes sp.]
MRCCLCDCARYHFFFSHSFFVPFYCNLFSIIVTN